MSHRAAVFWFGALAAASWSVLLACLLHLFLGGKGVVA